MDELDEEINDINTLMNGKLASDLADQDIDKIIIRVRDWLATKASGKARARRPKRATDVTVDENLLSTIFGPAPKPAPQPTAGPPTRR